MSYSGFEIEEDLRQERLEWRIQRIVWPILYLFLVAIVLGLLGNGILSKADGTAINTATHGTSGAGKPGFRIEYERFLRHRAPEVMKISVPAAEEKIAMRIDRRYLDKVHLKTIMPTPERTVFGKDAVTYFFAASPGAAADILIEVQAERIGTVDGWIAIGDQPRLDFSHFVYP